MNWKRVFGEGIGISMQRLLKIAVLRADKKLTDIRMFLVKLLHRERFVLRDIQGSKMYLNVFDRGISTDLYFKGKRECLATDEFQRRLKQKMVVADIGANIGYFALMEAKAVGHDGKVYAIEPVDENIALLQKNVQINNYGNIELFNLAIGDKNCVREFILSKYSNLGTFCEGLNLKSSGKRKPVLVQTLDSFLQNKRKPDFVRMDVEGFEFEILKGAMKTLKEGSKMQLFIEVHADFMGQKKTIEFFRLLKKAGVNKCRVIKESPDAFKFLEKILSKKVLPAQWVLDRSIDELVQDKIFHSGVYHLFAEKSG